MHNYNFGQVQCVERVKWIHAKFMSYFLMFIQFSINFRTLYEFLELNKQKWELENNLPATGLNPGEAQHGRPSMAAEMAHGRLIPGWACSPCQTQGRAALMAQGRRRRWPNAGSRGGGHRWGKMSAEVA
jgi:hypothetical protein